MQAPESRIEHLGKLRARLEEAVVGQQEAVRELAQALLAGEMGHTPAGRPRSILLLLGPSGTGKTQSVLAASEHLFGRDAVGRINAAEFSSDERVPLLLGAREGSRGILGETLLSLREKGGRILLLDEIEKASTRVTDLLLGIEEASLQFGNGERADLSGLHVIATSNLGAASASQLTAVSRTSLRRILEQEATAFLRPEVVARFTRMIVFEPLGHETQVAVCRAMLDREIAFQSACLSRQFGHPHRITADPSVVRRLASEGWHRTLGARPMRNAVERNVRSAIVEARLCGALAPGIRNSELVCGAAAGLRLVVGLPAPRA